MVVPRLSAGGALPCREPPEAGIVGIVTRIDPETDALIADWLSLPEAAAALDTSEKQVRHLLREGKLAGFDRGGRQPQIPAAFVRGGQVIKGLAGTLTLLADSGFDDVEALRWLFTPQESLPGTPVEALAQDRGKEVKRRAQALAF